MDANRYKTYNRWLYNRCVPLEAPGRCSRATRLPVRSHSSLTKKSNLEGALNWTRIGTILTIDGFTSGLYRLTPPVATARFPVRKHCSIHKANVEGGRIRPCQKLTIDGFATHFIRSRVQTHPASTLAFVIFLVVSTPFSQSHRERKKASFK